MYENIKHFKCERSFFIQYQHLDDLIKEVYGFPYEFVAYEELCNDTDKKFIVTNEPYDDFELKYDLKEIESFKTKGKIGGWRTNLLLRDMCMRGIIEPGNYVVEVSW